MTRPAAQTALPFARFLAQLEDDTRIDECEFAAWLKRHRLALHFRFYRSHEPVDEFGAWVRLEFLAETRV